MIAIERNLLRIGLILAVSYQLLQTLIGIWNGTEYTLVFLNLFFAILFLLLLYPLSQFTQGIAFIFHLIVLAEFAFFWVNTEGINETVPDMMCLYFSFIAVVSRKYFRIIALALHGTLVYILLYRPELFGILKHFDFTDISLLQNSVEYGIVTLFMVIFVGYMKVSYVEFHSTSVKRFNQLQQAGTEFHLRNEELAARQEEVRMINENLESLVQVRAAEIERKNKDLSEYAFINAHMVRAPLSRVIGLSNLMEGAPETFPADKVRAIKALAHEMDLIVKEIGRVLD